MPTLCKIMPSNFNAARFGQRLRGSSSALERHMLHSARGRCHIGARCSRMRISRTCLRRTSQLYWRWPSCLSTKGKCTSCLAGGTNLMLATCSNQRLSAQLRGTTVCCAAAEALRTCSALQSKIVARLLMLGITGTGTIIRPARQQLRQHGTRVACMRRWEAREPHIVGRQGVQAAAVISYEPSVVRAPASAAFTAPCAA